MMDGEVELVSVSTENLILGEGIEVFNGEFLSMCGCEEKHTKVIPVVVVRVTDHKGEEHDIAFIEESPIGQFFLQHSI